MLTPALSNTLNRSDNIFLPTTISFEGRTDRQAQPKKSNRDLAQLYKIIPTQIARKIESDTVYEEKPEINSPLRNRLHLISEDPFENSPLLPKDYSRALTEQSESIQPNGSSAQKSIFETEGFRSAKYQEINKGPIVRSGKLVRHSIVGSQEIFERYQRRRYYTKFQETDTSTISSDRESTLTFPKPARQISGVSMVLDGTPHHRTPSKKIVESKYKEPKKEVRISKEHLLSEIDDMKDRQQKFYEKIDRISHGLKTSDMLYFTKEQRCLEHFDKTHGKWQRLLENTNIKLGRAPTDSVVAKAETFREKKEQAATFDIIKNDQERYGAQHFYMSLRKIPGVKEKRGTVLTDDIPTGFKSAILDRPISTLEIIRKPKMMNQSNSTVEMPQQTLLSVKLTERTKVEYYERRFRNNLDQINKIKATAPDPESLMLVGENVLDNEINAAMKFNNKDTYPINLIKNKKEDNKEEVFVSSFDKKRLYLAGSNVITEVKLPSLKR